MKLLFHQQNMKAGRVKKREKRDIKKFGLKPAPKVPKRQPHTLETLREEDVTTVGDADEELFQEEANDAYAEYFSKSYEPKILVTSTDNPHKVSHMS